MRTTTYQPGSPNPKGTGIYDSCATICVPSDFAAPRSVCTKSYASEGRCTTPVIMICMYMYIVTYSAHSVRSRKEPLLMQSSPRMSIFLLNADTQSNLMTLWRCNSTGHDVRGFECPPNAQHIGDSSKVITCHATYHERKYGRKGDDFSYNSASGCSAAGQHPDIRAALECPAAAAQTLTATEIASCANKLCMKVGAIA